MCSIDRLNRGDGLARGHAVACFGQVHVDNIPKLLLRMILYFNAYVYVYAHTHIYRERERERERETDIYMHACM